MDDIEHYVDSVYELRNRMIRYLAPVIILMLMPVSWYMTAVVMRPIRQLENSLADLTSSNLDKPIDVLPPSPPANRVRPSGLSAAWQGSAPSVGKLPSGFSDLS